MGSSAGTSEIVEMNEELASVNPSTGSKNLSIRVRADKPDAYTAEDDLDRLIRAIDLRTSSRVLRPSGQAASEFFRKDILKRPSRVEISQASGIGISESVTLKQALRKLCISQASEMAAMKRLTKPLGTSGVSEAGMIRKLYASVVDEGKRNVVEISIMPEEIMVDSSAKPNKYNKSENVESPVQTAMSPLEEASSNKLKVPKMRIQDIINPTSAEAGESLSNVQARKEKSSSKTTSPSSQNSIASHKPIVTSRIVKPVFHGKTSAKKKGKKELSSVLGDSCQCSETNKNRDLPIKSKSHCHKESACPVPNNVEPTSSITENFHSSASKIVGAKMSECSRSIEKAECSHSSKSSIGDYSTSTSISDESHQSVVSSNGSRPHMSKDVRWTSIRDVVNQQGGLGLKNFDLLKKLGCGDIGTVYVAELVGTECLFALKVMDIDFLISRKKMLRAQTEREILQMLDHPFLPTLFAHFTTDNLSCLVMEYCPGGDLHVLRQKQPGRCFTEPAARFYVAEVLLALEYLHMLGVIYRDLKPENILVREDGHIMLSDFDLSLRCSVCPMLVRSSFDTLESSKKLSGPCAENSCIEPLCLQPSWVQATCFTPRLVSTTAGKARKPNAGVNGQVNRLPQLVVEPTDARSNSFVGTHEYLAPEIIRGDGHGSSVDWWTFGIFLYELLFGRTPFKGPGNEETLTNVISQILKFPENPAVSFHARDLIRGLLVKEPENRLGSVKGAAEIKKHPFFEGLNWALIRCAAPPEVLKCYDVGTPAVVQKKKTGRCLDFRTKDGEDLEFELF